MKFSFLVLSSLLVTQGLFSQEKVTSVTSNNGNTITWTILEPDVKRPSEPFTQIRFQKNDEIRITAGGCVQTGGSGKTWKRYVNPSGDGNAYWYFGKIQIPGVTYGLARMEQYLNRQLFFTPTPDNNSYLILGYADNNYGDNGYWGHDDGTQDQCKGVGNAFVTIAITHHTTPPTNTQTTFKDWDVVAKELDDNGLPLNPIWGKQAGSGKSPDFTTFNESDYPVYVNSGFRCGSHFNFAPITYQGQIGWEGHSNSVYDDDDYYGPITRADRALYTTNGEELLHWEFNSDETVDNWDQTSTWWNLFHHNAVDVGDNEAHSHLDNDSAIIIGLLNIDEQHHFPVELHPVYAMFLKQQVVNFDNIFPVAATNNNLVYHFFVRNWGDQGYCSSGQEYLFYNYVKIKIPGAAKMTAANVYIPGDSKYNQMGWSVEYQADGALLTFHLNQPADKSWFVGDLAFDRLPNYGKVNGVRQIEWNKLAKVATEVETPAQASLQSNWSKFSKNRQDSITKVIKQLVQHGTIKKVTVSAAPLNAPSRAVHYAKYTKFTPTTTAKSMHTADPERDKREQMKQQIIDKYIGSTQVKKPPIQGKVSQPVKN